jgi:DNA repair protein RadC
VSTLKCKSHPKEFKLVALRECPAPEEMQICDTPEKAAAYWNSHITQAPQFISDCECLAVLWLNTRRRIKGHQIISIGTLDTILVHPREVFRGVIVANAAAVILMHNHPSGEPEPSEADVKITRDLVRAGQLLKIEVLDHVIVGHNRHSSLRTLGYFY